MKLKILKRNDLKINLAIAVTLLAGCAKSQFGQEAGTAGNAAAATSTSPRPGSEIAEYNANSEVSRALVDDSSSAADLSFLDTVASADFTINGKSLRISLKDCDDSRVSIPSALLAKAKFKNSPDFILVRLSDGSTITNFVVDKASKHVYLTKDTDIAEIDLGTSIAKQIDINGVSQSVLQIKARIGSSSALVSAAIYIADSTLNLYKL